MGILLQLRLQFSHLSLVEEGDKGGTIHLVVDGSGVVQRMGGTGVMGGWVPCHIVTMLGRERGRSEIMGEVGCAGEEGRRWKLD